MVKLLARIVVLTDGLADRMDKYADRQYAKHKDFIQKLRAEVARQRDIKATEEGEDVDKP